MKYKWFALALSAQLVAAPAQASQEENRLMAVFFGRFASYIELPERASKHFVITVIDENPFGSSIFQFRYEPEGTGIQVTSNTGLIGLKGEV
jgi:hypothetical protein